MSDQIALGQELPPEDETAYQRMKRLGVNMSWYEKAKKNQPVKRGDEAIPLTDDKCSMLSIYYLDKSGKMYTTTSDGKPYEHGLVRQGKKIAHAIYLCAACKEQFSTYDEATAHYSKSK